MRNEKVSNIILIGMSGAGKSTLGVLLAKALGKEFVDTDLLLQKQEKRLLQKIIDQEGTKRFMEIEEALLSGLCLQDSVIATGGSAIYYEKAMDSLKRNGITVYLYVSWEEVKRRVYNASSRGIVMQQGHTMQEVYEERLPFYEKYADIVYDCEGKKLEQCVQEIQLLINKE